MGRLSHLRKKLVNNINMTKQKQQKCKRCGNTAIVETDRGIYLCDGCDSIRLSCLNNIEEEKSEEDFYKSITGVKI